MAAAAPGTGSETLRERITALQASLAANSAALAQTQRQRRKIERQQEQGGLGPVGRQRVLCVYVLSNYNADLAVRAACQYSTVKDPSSPGYPTRTFVEDLFLAASDADFNCIHEDSRRFVAQWETCRWVSSLNAVGVAPLSRDVFDHYEQRAFGSTLDIGMPARRYVNKWVQRWRSEWGVQRKVLRQEIQSDPAILQAKAGGFPRWRSRFWVRETDPKTSPLHVRFIARGSKITGLFLAPFFVPFPSPPCRCFAGESLLEAAGILCLYEICRETNPLLEFGRDQHSIHHEAFARMCESARQTPPHEGEEARCQRCIDLRQHHL